MKGTWEWPNCCWIWIAILSSVCTRSVTPLHIAAHAGHLEMVRLLLDVENRDQRTPNRGATPLHAAVQEGRLEVAEFLLRNGADHRKATDTGCTALHVAAQKGHPNVVRLLLEHGADKKAKTLHGATPFSLAARAGNMEAIRLLKPKRRRVLKDSTWLWLEPCLYSGRFPERGNLDPICEGKRCTHSIT